MASGPYATRHYRRLQQELAISFSAARRIDAVQRRFQRLLHANLKADTEAKVAHARLRACGDTSQRTRVAYTAGAVVRSLLVDFHPALAFTAAVVPLANELIQNLASLQLHSTLVEQARRIWAPCRSRIAELTALLPVSAQIVDQATGHLAAREQCRWDGLHQHVETLVASLSAAVPTVESTSDVLLAAIVDAEPERHVEPIFEPWLTLESEIDVMWHCSRRLERNAADLTGQRTPRCGPRQLARLMGRDERVTTDPREWTAAARRRYWDILESRRS